MAMRGTAQPSPSQSPDMSKMKRIGSLAAKSFNGRSMRNSVFDDGMGGGLTQDYQNYRHADSITNVDIGQSYSRLRVLKFTENMVDQ